MRYTSRDDIKKAVEQVKTMYNQGKFKSPEYGEMCMTVARLAEDSDFGRQGATSELVLKSRGPENALMDDSLDGIAIQLGGIADEVLGEFGNISTEPYSGGILSRTAMLTYEPRK